MQIACYHRNIIDISLTIVVSVFSSNVDLLVFPTRAIDCANYFLLSPCNCLTLFLAAIYTTCYLAISPPRLGHVSISILRARDYDVPRSFCARRRRKQIH